MAKKFKKQKKTNRPAPEKISEEKKTIITPRPQQAETSQSFLIRFDKKTKIFLLILVGLYLILSLLKIHTSNIGNWDLYFGKPESESVIAGKPRFIRMDEWMISTPGALSQYQLGMPIKNEALGAENTPVIWGLPIKDISTLLRPNFWSYFIFDEERAFAFSWNFNLFFCVLTTFLLLMLLSRNNFGLSVFGSLFIFFSSGIQWWSYQIGAEMIYLNGMLISFLYILYSKKILPLILSGIFLILSVHGFAFNLYPPFQVPLVYLYLFIFIGFIWQRKNFKVIKEKLLLKAAVLSIALIILGIFLLHYYHLVKDTYTMMLNTVYPGRRFSTGGDLVKGKFFADFFGMFMTDTNLPKQWLNICEESCAIMFFPIIFYGIGYRYFRSRKIDPLLASLSVYFIIGSIYVLIGFPAFLSKLTLISMSPSYRAFPVLAIGNIFLLICYLASKPTELSQNKFSWPEFGILAVSIIVFIRIVSSHINDATENFFTSGEVMTATILVTLSYLLIRYHYVRFAKPVLYAVLTIMIFKNIGANPVTMGLSAIRENPVVQTTKAIHDKDPKPKWAVFGKGQSWESPRLANLLKTNGINTFNGTKFVPPIKEMRVLDPSGQYDSAYNRYAWVVMNAFIAGNDSVVIRQAFNDGYIIYVDPCSPRLKQLGVKYFVFNYKPDDTEVRCMTKIDESSGMFYYKRNDE